jgi:seryl-tRNA synthetase
MLDIKFIRENIDKVKGALKNRNCSLDIDHLMRIDREQRALVAEADRLKNIRNNESEEIAILKRSGKDTGSKVASMKVVSQKIKELDQKVGDLTSQVKDIIMQIPNIPHESLPIGPDSSSNKTVRQWGRLPNFKFKPLNHMELAQSLNIMDFARAAKLSGAGFSLFMGDGARMVRALINFMLDMHTQKHGYKEVWPPALVNRQSMTATGQLPKLEDDMYRLKDEDLFLIPTAEVPVTNIYRDAILNGSDLPIYYTAYTPCFRKEAGSYGRETKGLSRVHQFDKIEMVKFVRPETSYDELEKLLKDAEDILQALKLPYRVQLLCTGDISFAASKCYDIELWAPGAGAWLEVSSCSNFEGFQARRGNIRFKVTDTDKLHFVHTLNGSGVALARLIIAILENYQRKDGSVDVPRALRPYLGKKRFLKSDRI